MSQWHSIQSAVSSALQKPDLPPPAAVSKLKGNTLSQKRFNVYRNNVALSLINVLGDTFPVTKELTGEDFFTSMARHFISGNLPKSPVMLTYGDIFPAFVKAYKPAESLPFLSDIAALEWARNAAYHGQDAVPLAIEELAGFQEEEIPALTFALHPTLSLLSSDWPIVSIWHAHQQEEPEEALKNLGPLEKSAEQALILRPHLDVNVQTISASALHFLKQLSKGRTFGESVEEAVKQDPSFDLPANLAGLFNSGAVTSISIT